MSAHRPERSPRALVAVSAAGLLLAVVGAAGCSSSEPPRAQQSASVDGPVREEGAAGARPSTQQDRATAFPDFAASVRRIGPQLRDRMRFSHRPGCPLPLRDLRYLRMSFVGFRGAARTGEMVVRETHARRVVRVFHRLYDERWPVRRMRLVDDYRGNDDRSMSANNTSGYNCRLTSSGDRWSEHSYGRAIDINPVQNPYVVGSVVAPEEGRRFARIDRSADAAPRRGVIRSRDVVVSAFARVGWEWGGNWVNSKDYQHFSATGR